MHLCLYFSISYEKNVMFIYNDNHIHLGVNVGKRVKNWSIIYGKRVKAAIENKIFDFSKINEILRKDNFDSVFFSTTHHNHLFFLYN